MSIITPREYYPDDYSSPIKKSSHVALAYLTSLRSFVLEAFSFLFAFNKVRHPDEKIGELYTLFQVSLIKRPKETGRKFLLGRGEDWRNIGKTQSHDVDWRSTQLSVSDTKKTPLSVSRCIKIFILRFWNDEPAA